MISGNSVRLDETSCASTRGRGCGAVREGPPNARKQIFELDRFQQVVSNSKPNALDRGGKRRGAGHYDKRNVGPVGSPVRKSSNFIFPGIFRSDSTRSKVSRESASNAAEPFGAVVQSKPSLRSNAAVVRRNNGSSSAIKIRAEFASVIASYLLNFHPPWKNGRKYSAATCALRHINASAHRFDQTARDG